MTRKRPAEVGLFSSKIHSKFKLEDISPTPAVSIPQAATYNDPIEADNVCILGNLRLPHPSRIDDDSLRARVLELLPHVQQLDKRNLRDLPDRIVDIEYAFAAFAEAESEAWESSTQGQPRPDDLVRPSGSLDSIISHHLHQPSFTTAFPGHGTTADQTNGCMAMVMYNGFHPGETLIFDHLHRRSVTSRGLIEYPAAVIDVHENFTRQLMSSSTALVEVVYGKHAQTRILETMRCSILPLWDFLEANFLVLLHESNFENQQTGFMFRRVLLFAVHPQRLFYERPDSPITVQQDVLFEIAGRIIRMPDRFDPHYYRKKKWQSTLPGSLAVAKQKAENLARLISSQHSLGRREDDQQLAVDVPSREEFESNATYQDEWDHHFLTQPHSNADSRRLLPLAIASVEEAMAATTTDWATPKELPSPVYEWFCGQKQVLFWAKPISRVEDIKNSLESYRNRLDDAPTEPQNDLCAVLRKLMLAQQQHLSKAVWAHDEFFFTRIDGISVETICPCGGFRSTDVQPRYSCLQANGYIMRRTRRCKSFACRQKPMQSLHPISEILHGVYHDIQALRSSSIRKHDVKPVYEGCLRISQDLPCVASSVDLWCPACKTESLFRRRGSSSDQRIYTDKSPRWTLGNRRPLYVCCYSICQNCDSRVGLIPMDAEIPFIDPKRLSSFHNLFGSYEDCVKAALLDDWPSTQRRAQRRDKSIARKQATDI